MTGFPAGGGGLVKRATTGPGGFALLNGTPTILTYTTPNDGRLHSAKILGVAAIGAGVVGGQVNIQFTVGGVAQSLMTLTGGLAAGTDSLSWLGRTDVIVDPNTVVAFTQVSALTGGAVSIFAALWVD